MKVTKRTVYAGDGFEFLFEPVEDTITVEETESGFIVRYLVQETDPESPCSWGDDSLFLVNYHRDFFVECKEVITKEQFIKFCRGGKIDQAKEYFILPLSCLVHSGVWLSLGRDFSCDPGGWDTSHVGAVFASKKEFSKREDAAKAAQSLVDEWNMYLSGDVYGCVVEYYDKDKNQTSHSSTWGFYGLKYALEESKDYDRVPEVKDDSDGNDKSGVDEARSEEP